MSNETSLTIYEWSNGNVNYIMCGESKMASISLSSIQLRIEILNEFKAKGVDIDKVDIQFKTKEDGTKIN